MNLRLLQPEEYERLREVPTGAERIPNPDSSLVYVVENDAKEIVATWIIVNAAVADGLWKREDQPAGLGARMVLSILHDLKDRGLTGVATITDNPVVLDMAHRMGFQDVAGTLLIKSL